MWRYFYSFVYCSVRSIVSSGLKVKRNIWNLPLAWDERRAPVVT